MRVTRKKHCPFKIGDTIKRIAPSWGVVAKGEECLLVRIQKNGYMILSCDSRRKYNPDNFELVKPRPVTFDTQMEEAIYFAVKSLEK